MLNYRKQAGSSGNSDGESAPPERQRIKDQERIHKQNDFYEENGSCNKNDQTAGNLASEVITFSNKQKNLLQRIAVLESQRLNIEPIPLRFESLTDDCGYYEPINKAIFVNTVPGVHKDFLDLVDTVIHETRHAYQYNVFLFHPEKYPSIPEQIKSYLDLSSLVYKDDIHSPADEEEYQNNGLEKDARSYAKGRLEIYKDYTVKQIMKMQQAPAHTVHNQILFTPGDSGPDGNSGPVVVSSDFKENKDYTMVVYEELLNITSNPKKGKKMSGKRTNLSQEAQKKAVQYYSDIIGEIQSRSEVLVSQLKDEVKKHPYSQYQEAVNIFVRYYNTDLPNAIKSSVESWINSDHSISHIVKAHKAGSEAIRNAQKLEKELEDSVNTRFRQIDELKQDVSEMNINKEEILYSAQYVNSYKTALDNIKSDTTRKLELMAEENSIYSGILEAVINTFNNVIGTFEGTAHTLTNLADEFENVRAGNVSDNISNSKSIMNNIVNLKDRFNSSRQAFEG